MSNLRREADPVVSVVMAAFNVAPYIDQALFSVRGQSLEAIEILVVDDGSTDGTRLILERHRKEDDRIRILDGAGRGPAAARNLAIAQARGRWIAIIDADDLIAQHRLAYMTTEADRDHLDAVADNMTAFYENAAVSDHLWIDPQIWPEKRALTFDDLMAGGLGTPPAPELGYLKPLLRRDRLAQLPSPYREDLIIGEDFDLMARWTAAGFSYCYLPEPGYRYRRRASSLSYRLTADQIEGMLVALEAFGSNLPEWSARGLARRRDALRAIQRYTRRVDRLKRGDPTALLAIGIDPDNRKRLAVSVREGLTRRLGRPLPA